MAEGKALKIPVKHQSKQALRRSCELLRLIANETSRPTSESSSKELNLGCKLSQTWMLDQTLPGPYLT